MCNDDMHAHDRHLGDGYEIEAHIALLSYRSFISLVELHNSFSVIYFKKTLFFEILI